MTINLGCWSSKRAFVESMQYMARNKSWITLTARQRNYLALIAWQFREQLTAKGQGRLVPKADPSVTPEDVMAHAQGSEFSAGKVLTTDGTDQHG